MANAVPILGNNKEHLGINISIQNMEEVHSYASKLMGNFSKYSFDDIQGESVALEQVKTR